MKKFRDTIAGIIWANDPAGVGEFRQTDEYDSYAAEIENVKDGEELLKVLNDKDIYTNKLYLDLLIFFGFQ